MPNMNVNKTNDILTYFYSGYVLFPAFTNANVPEFPG
jgi:hypothetical protein